MVSEAKAVEALVCGTSHSGYSSRSRFASTSPVRHPEWKLSGMDEETALKAAAANTVKSSILLASVKLPPEAEK